MSVDTTVKQLVMSVCSRENLNPRHHSLQYIDFKHEFIDAGSTVNEIEVKQVRLMDKRGKTRSFAKTQSLSVINMFQFIALCIPVLTVRLPSTPECQFSLYLLQIFLQISLENLVLDQDNNFFLRSLSILITLVLSNV